MSRLHSKENGELYSKKKKRGNLGFSFWQTSDGRFEALKKRRWKDQLKKNWGFSSQMGDARDLEGSTQNKKGSTSGGKNNMLGTYTYRVRSREEKRLLWNMLGTYTYRVRSREEKRLLWKIRRGKQSLDLGGS
ncbi:hypothetical protein KP509_01G067000 [Ceratopteris richardii]|uniref:Uncharacterized protein n=1 Tax=Ceratopteris richardii TaxID=49495 RepID=A0A8T2VDX3_CERRI|nr:hypothetical protein KP509_01G067000 [Ceratopteris richardii]